VTVNASFSFNFFTLSLAKFSTSSESGTGIAAANVAKKVKRTKAKNVRARIELGRKMLPVSLML